MNDFIVGFCIDESGTATDIFQCTDTSVTAENDLGEVEEWVMMSEFLRGASFEELTLSRESCKSYFGAIAKVIASEYSDSLYGFIMLSDNTVLAINGDRDTAYQLTFPALATVGNSFSIENYLADD
jgi:hypothetical protein